MRKEKVMEKIKFSYTTVMEFVHVSRTELTLSTGAIHMPPRKVLTIIFLPKLKYAVRKLKNS